MSGTTRDDAVLLRLIAEHGRFWQRGTELRESNQLEEANGYDAGCHGLRDLIRVTKPTTLAGAIAQLEFAAEWDDPDMVKTVAAGLRDISGQHGDPEAAIPAPSNPDRLAAAVSEALALRLLSRYRDARGAVEDYGGEVSSLPVAPSFAEIEERYTKLIREEVLAVRPETTSAELRFLDLVEAIIADRLSPHDAPVTSDEEDLGCALQLVQWVRSRANSRDLAEGIAEWREAQS